MEAPMTSVDNSFADRTGVYGQVEGNPRRRQARVDLGEPPLSPDVFAAPAMPRQGKSSAAALRKFIAGLEQEARERAPKGTRKTGSTRPLKRWTQRDAQRVAER
jgi:hypothetical protein